MQPALNRGIPTSFVERTVCTIVFSKNHVTAYWRRCRAGTWPNFLAAGERRKQNDTRHRNWTTRPSSAYPNIRELAIEASTPSPTRSKRQPKYPSCHCRFLPYYSILHSFQHVVDHKLQQAASPRQVPRCQSTQPAT